jgi:isoleucyl-tRNA synthetase
MVTGALNAGDVQQATERLAAALQVLGDWQAQPDLGVRREVLASLCQLLAPFVPHLADAFNRRLGRKVESVHLEDWPLLDPDWARPVLLRSTAEIWRLARLGQLARETYSIQPELVLREAGVGRIGGDFLDILERDEFRSLLTDLLRVREVRPSSYTAAPVIWSLSLERGRFSGREGATAEIEAALEGLGPERTTDLAANLIAGLSVALEVESGAITLLPDEVRISGTAKPGWATATEGGLFVALAVG